VENLSDEVCKITADNKNTTSTKTNPLNLLTRSFRSAKRALAQRDDNIATKIQSLQRGKLGRQKFKLAEQSRKNTLAGLIQRIARGKIGRKLHQAHWLFVQQMEKLEAEKQMINKIRRSAAIIIQNKFRGNASLAQVLKMITERKEQSATRIQSKLEETFTSCDTTSTRSWNAQK